MKNTVLIVDDSPLYCELLKNIVENLGYEAVTCGDGSEAMRYMAENNKSIMLMFLDIYMPEVDGISALGHFRNRYPELPVVIITGSNDDDDIKAAEGLGAAGYLRKPFPAGTIQETIHDLIVKIKPLAQGAV